jgi:hypothetical protein
MVARAVIRGECDDRPRRQGVLLLIRAREKPPAALSTLTDARAPVKGNRRACGD